MQVYLLWHVHELDADQDDEKLIGVYSSEGAANEALERAKHLPGFCDLPEGFLIALYTLDEDHWREGYVTVYPNEM
jgi:hypothetical protein